MLDERFWSKVDKSPSSGCWEWTSVRNNKGYGMFSVNSYVGKQLAHRLSYADTNGPIPKGGLILHSCDNPACVNPNHLRVGSHKDNVADMDNRGRRVVNPPRGEDNHNSKLTAEQVIAMRVAYVSGERANDIADRFGVSHLSISDITGGRSWKHILGVNGSPTLKDLKDASKTSPLSEQNVREVWKLHLSGKSLPEIVKLTSYPYHSVAGIVSGKSWRHLHDAPSAEELRAGGVSRGYNQFSGTVDTRSVHPKTKVPTSEIPTILSRIEAGETLESIGKTYGVKKSAIWRIKAAAKKLRPSDESRSLPNPLS